jgi:chromosome segregation ATPase
MADGAITFSTTLDNSDLEKSLKAVEREIESLKRKIEESKGEESFAKSQMEAAKAATEKAKQAVEKLREELGVTDDAALAESLKAANREVSQLEAGLRKANEGKSAIEEQMDAGEAAIRQTEQSLRELQARLGELENADPTNADEWFAAQREISGVKSALADANASLDKQIADQDKLNDKWQALDEKATDYAARLEGASARQAELASKSSRLSAANDALKQQSAEQDRLTKKWESTNAQTEKYTRQLARATKRQQELSAEYSRTYSAAGAAVGAGMERARASMSAFSDKVQTMLKRVFVFGIILKGIRAVSGALGTALGQNLRFSAAWENLRATVTGVANAIANLVAPALVGMVNAATAAIETLAKTVDDLFGLGRAKLNL